MSSDHLNEEEQRKAMREVSKTYGQKFRRRKRLMPYWVPWLVMSPIIAFYLWNGLAVLASGRIPFITIVIVVVVAVLVHKVAASVSEWRPRE